MIRWSQKHIDPRPEGMLPAPHFEWARATQFIYYGQATWLPVLIELKEAAPLNTAQAFARRVFEMQANAHDQGWAADVRVPRFHAEPPLRLNMPTHFLAVLARKAFLVGLYDGVGPAASVRRFELGRANSLSCAEPVDGCVPDVEEQFDCPTSAVVTGVIDDGMAFAHDRFLDSHGRTRIEYVFDQHLPPAPGWGVELSKRHAAAGIDKLMTEATHGARVDEDEVYRRSGHVDHAKPGHKPLATCAAHGTHVMDLACNAPGPAIPPLRPAPGARPIIAVQLPAATVQDTSGATLRPQIFHGLWYILWRADTLARQCNSAPLPLVVNISYGLIAGPHDGSDLLESAMDDLIESCNPPGIAPFRVVLPAGNSHLSRCHAHFSLPPGASRKLAWRVLPDDWTESSVEIWLPPGSDGKTLAFSITAPGGGQSTGTFFAGTAWDVEDNGQLVGKACYYPPATPAERALVRFAIAPTGWPDGGLPLAPAGLWIIEIKNPEVAGAVDHIHAWIQRDDTAPGFKRRGRQSYFDDPQYRRYDDGGRAIEDDADPRTAASCVKREGTLNAIATGTQPIVIGGFRRSDRAAAPYSASGPLVPPGRGAPSPDGPDALLPSDDSPSQHGVLAGGTRSNSCVAMNGTSVAAPQAAFRIAERMALPLPIDRQVIFDGAAAHEGGTAPPAKRFGGGRIPNDSTRRPR